MKDQFFLAAAVLSPPILPCFLFFSCTIFRLARHKRNPHGDEAIPWLLSGTRSPCAPPHSPSVLTDALPQPWTSWPNVRRFVSLKVTPTSPSVPPPAAMPSSVRGEVELLLMSLFSEGRPRFIIDLVFSQSRSSFPVQGQHLAVTLSLFLR